MEIYLKEFSKDNLNATFDWMQNAELKHDFLFRKEITLDEHEQWFESLVDDETQKIWAIYYDKVHVGNIGIKAITRTDRRAETWIYIGNDLFRGKGIASKAYQNLFKIIKNELPFIHKLYCNIASWNLPSLSLFLRNDFQIEGILKDELLVDNHFINIYRLYIIL